MLCKQWYVNNTLQNYFGTVLSGSFAAKSETPVFEKLLNCQKKQEKPKHEII